MAGIKKQPFALSSWSKQRPPVSAPLHPDSNALVASLERQAQQYFVPTINVGAYSTSTYTAGPHEQLTAVKSSNCQHKKNDAGLLTVLGAVPIPANAQPPIGTDGSMCIWQPSTGTVWELWKAEKREDGWYACWGGRIDNATSSDGTFPFPYGVCASGLSLLAGMIRVNELQQGVIRHALGLSIPETRKAVSVPPATRTDGTTDDPMAIAEGQRFRLDRSLDLSTLKLSPVARIIATAVQRYGLVVQDRAGAVAFQAENPAVFASNPYPSLFQGKPLYTVLGGFPWDRLQALASPGDVASST